MNPRPPIAYPLNIINEIDQFWYDKIRSKGVGIFDSSHEILGKLFEEFHEFGDAVHDNNLIAQRAELLDIIVIAAHGIASIDSGKMGK